MQHCLIKPLSKAQTFNVHLFALNYEIRKLLTTFI